MYIDHFGLALKPFSLGPDPRFFYLTNGCRDALSILAYGVSARCGFIQLTGDVGTGKTTLLNVFLQWLDKRGDATAFITNPHLPADDFLETMWEDFGLGQDSMSKGQRTRRFNRWLLKRYGAGKLVVLIVDEAQQLSEEVLEELRLLTNLETPTHKLLQIVLSGQPELEAILRRPSLRQLRQRITLRCKTTAFSMEQSLEYVKQRMQIAGAVRSDTFSPEALQLIYDYSGGTARLINVLCEQSLIRCSDRGLQMVSTDIVDQAAIELGLGQAEYGTPDGTAPQRSGELTANTAMALAWR